FEAVARGRKTFAVEFRIARRARTETVICKRRLMGVNEGHAIAAGVAAQYAALAQRECLQLREEFALHIVRYIGQPLRVGVERRMDIEAGAPAGARRTVGQGRIGVGYI